MNQITIELIPDPEQGGFTARIPDIPAYREGETEQEAIEDLKESIRGYIETFRARGRSNPGQFPRDSLGRLGLN